MAGDIGFEPMTHRLTADCAAATPISHVEGYIFFLTLHKYYNIFFLKNQERFFYLNKMAVRRTPFTTAPIIC